MLTTFSSVTPTLLDVSYLRHAVEDEDRPALTAIIAESDFFRTAMTRVVETYGTPEGESVLVSALAQAIFAGWHTRGTAAEIADMERLTGMTEADILALRAEVRA